MVVSAGKLRKLWPSHPGRGCQDPLKQRAKSGDEMSEAQLQQLLEIAAVYVHQKLVRSCIRWKRSDFCSGLGNGNFRQNDRCSSGTTILVGIILILVIQCHPPLPTIQARLGVFHHPQLRPLAARSLRMLPPNSLVAPWLLSKRLAETPGSTVIFWPSNCSNCSA